MYTVLSRTSKVELDNYGAHTEAQGTGSLRQGYHRRGTQCIGTRFMSTGHEEGGAPGGSNRPHTSGQHRAQLLAY